MDQIPFYALAANQWADRPVRRLLLASASSMAFHHVQQPGLQDRSRGRCDAIVDERSAAVVTVFAHSIHRNLHATSRLSPAALDSAHRSPSACTALAMTSTRCGQSARSAPREVRRRCRALPACPARSARRCAPTMTAEANPAATGTDGPHDALTDRMLTSCTFSRASNSMRTHPVGWVQRGPLRGVDAVPRDLERVRRPRHLETRRARCGRLFGSSARREPSALRRPP